MIKNRLFVGGGQDYWGETAERDRKIVKEASKILFELVGDSIEIVTGGMPGIPDDFVHAWLGTSVLCVISEEHLENYLARDLPFDYKVVGKSQEARRLAVTRLEGIKCALFIQGGKYSTHEMKLLLERNDVGLVSFVGSGGAAGGDQPYNGWSYDTTLEKDVMLHNKDPLADVKEIAQSIAENIKKYF
jgi:hypothetical protein